MKISETTYKDATHMLMCRHCVGPKSCKDYEMLCIPIKSMGDGRHKVRVFGDRYWEYTGDIVRTKYVDSSRLIKATYGQLKSLRDQMGNPKLSG